MIEPSVREIEDGWTASRRGEAGQAGIVDHISFIVMRRLGITEVFTNDIYFESTGFNVLF